LLRLPKQLQEHDSQGVWSRILQRLRGRPVGEPDAEVPQLQQGFRQVRCHAGASMMGSSRHRTLMTTGASSVTVGNRGQTSGTTICVGFAPWSHIKDAAQRAGFVIAHVYKKAVGFLCDCTLGCEIRVRHGLMERSIGKAMVCERSLIFAEEQDIERMPRKARTALMREYCTKSSYQYPVLISPVSCCQVIQRRLVEP
jgi:hypothetical protein